MIAPILERYEFREQDISVWVEIDYQALNISLIEKDGSKKKWLFAERGQMYMQGWLNILTVMQHATEHAKARLEAYLNKESEDFALMLYELSDERVKSRAERDELRKVSHANLIDLLEHRLKNDVPENLVRELLHWRNSYIDQLTEEK